MGWSSRKGIAESTPVPWVMIAALVALVLYLISFWLFDGEGLLGLFFSAVASAFVSVGVALLVTEMLLKPAQIRDIVQVAKLSAQVNDSGLIDMSRLIGWDSSAVMEKADSIQVLGKQHLIEHIWRIIEKEAGMRKTDVRVYVSEDFSRDSQKDLTRDWRQHCARSSLTIVPLDIGSADLTILTPRHCVVALDDGRGIHGDPLVLTFKIGKGSSFSDSLTRHFAQLDAQDVVPLYSSSTTDR